MTPKKMVVSFTGQAAPCLTIQAADSREILRITPSGEVIINPEFTVTEAARAFWEAVKRCAEA